MHCELAPSSVLLPQPRSSHQEAAPAASRPLAPASGRAAAGGRRPSTAPAAGAEGPCLLCRAARQRSARKGKPDNEEFGSAGLLSNHKQPSGGTKPALLHGKDKRSRWDSVEERGSEPARYECAAKYRSHERLDRERTTGPNCKGCSCTSPGWGSPGPPSPACREGGAPRSPRAPQPNPGPRAAVRTQQTAPCRGLMVLW